MVCRGICRFLGLCIFCISLVVFGAVGLGSIVVLGCCRCLGLSGVPRRLRRCLLGVGFVVLVFG